MERKITRTFKFFTVKIKDLVAGTEREEIFAKKPTRERVAVAYIKETGNTSFTIAIVEREELREMSLETFLANSKVVDPRVVQVVNPTPGL